VWNKCAQTLTGYGTEYVLGRHLVDEFVTSEFKTSVLSVLENAVKGVEKANFKFPLIHKDGKRAVHLLLNATCRRDGKGHPVGMVGIGQDITDATARTEAEMRQREAEAAHAARMSISAHIFHEIRNAVGSFLALAERASEAVDLALEETSGDLTKKLPAEIRFLTEHQRLVCDHAVHTLNDMLDVSRVESGNYTPASVVVDLGAVCLQATKLQGPRLRPGVLLHLDCPPPGKLFVLSDPALLLQYLTNLLSNSAKSTSTGHVVIKCVATPHASRTGWVEVVLGVADTGPGMLEEDQARALKAFETGNSVPCEDIGSSVRKAGIGLKLTKLIADILRQDAAPTDEADGKAGGLGGPLRNASSVERRCAKGKRGSVTRRRDGSENENSICITSPLPADLAKDLPGGEPGALLTITAAMALAPEELVRSWKLGADSSGPGVAPGQALSLDPAGVLRVLVTDDQRTMRQMVSMIFQKLCTDFPGMKVELTTALSGEEAVRLAATRHFHIITMDQALSASYCSGVMELQGSRARDDADSGRAFEPIPDAAPVLVLDANRVEAAKQRTEYFKDEIYCHHVLEGDGNMEGHMATKAILSGYAAAGRRDVPVVINLTGNVMEQDLMKYTRAGSFGVLPKPTKASELVALLERELPALLERGSVVHSRLSSGGGAFTTPDGAFRFACAPQGPGEDAGAGGSGGGDGGTREGGGGGDGIGKEGGAGATKANAPTPFVGSGSFSEPIGQGAMSAAVASVLASYDPNTPR